MNGLSDIDLYAMSDKAILNMIGSYLKETRLTENKTQALVAGEAGIVRSTLVQIENGHGGTLSTFIQLLRTLGQLHLIKQLQFKRQISPLQLAKLEQKKRQRARSKNMNHSKDQTDW